MSLARLRRLHAPVTLDYSLLIRLSQSTQPCTNLIVEFIIRYTPGSERWKGRAEMLEKVREDMPRDRPIPVEKTDTRPFGVFDANEGSKKGIIELLDLIRSRTTMSPEEWAGKVRVLLGDWLTSNNFRHARSDRKDDVSPMERLEYGEEVSQLFHFALQATQMIIRFCAQIVVHLSTTTPRIIENDRGRNIIFYE
ncbi:hypothetical protein DFP72DRAFT_860773 [Ephemerocybe angulata]|uniref:DUF6589 domain-containing protein n=1 Tax=Ephemerocybe angulata TaxID=980116 RepID=A0A8H6HAI6_9AGAR|nr:hypothetical protein DFP72DRAFT_1082264 [Tulosesus angulatus]KAF6742253.1 hypothetical protein DFP72DRAFT_860773 [Tulosesus angulatus]